MDQLLANSTYDPPIQPSEVNETDLHINIRVKEKQVLDQLLAEGRYDPRIRPPGVNETGIIEQ